MAVDRRSLVTLALVGVLCVPVAIDRDGYPVSLYPMYAGTRPDVVGFVTARGLDADGERVALSLGTIGASDDPLIVAGELRSAIAADRADERCEQIVARVDDDRVVAVEVVTERRDLIAHLSGGDEIDGEALVERVVHAECER